MIGGRGGVTSRVGLQFGDRWLMPFGVGHDFIARFDHPHDCAGHGGILNELHGAVDDLLHR